MSNSRIVTYTRAGLAELVSAKKQGIQGKITHCAIGTRSFAPDAALTALPNEVHRVEISDSEDISPGQIRLAAAFRGEQEYEVCSFGFFLESGTLLATYSEPGKMLSYKSAASSLIQEFTLDISPLPTGSVTVVVGTQNLNILLGEEVAVLATADIDNMSRQVDLLFRVMKLEGK
ncbi:phage tail protein [Pseudomonas sp. L5B5]|uniref:phage tail protein n=1 Tax=Pseudomonas sp. L5B5 TaxID=2883205 RepID=UPI001CFB9844|nr:phage tail protein [Pseudomonas sp. L5B5]UCZ87118.1 hypothetical protein LGQ10_12750 [Pseudomonas sp. L5B5]